MTILERLLRHDAWTTRALLKLSLDLSDDQLDAEFDIGHRSLRRTFVHIIRNMECWHDLMAGKPQRVSRDASSANSIGCLIERLDVVAAELLELGLRVVERRQEDQLFIDDLDNPPRQKPLGAGLVHVATHGMHHRAQCLYIMRKLGAPNLIEGDVLTWELSHRGLDSFPGV